MQIKVKSIKGNEVTVDMRQPTVREVKKIRNKLVELQDETKKGKEMKGLTDYLDYQDEITIKCATVEGKNITIDFLDDLPQDEKEKLTSVVGTAAIGELDFSKLFGRPLK